MSFKGFTKVVSRAPQSFRQKLNMGEQTLDPVYEDADRRFKELEQETKTLSDESTRYFTAVNGMLKHQIGFANAMEEIFKPISGQMSDPSATILEDNPEGIEASIQYKELVSELQSSLKPDLELIEDKIVKPSQELLKIIGYIRKMATKRSHKQLDLDRYLNSYRKFENKKELTPKDEEKKYKAEAQLEVAQNEYNYYNDMLKNELPVLFQLESEFVKPLFVSFYYMQLNIFYTLYNRMQDMKITYFNLSGDIMEVFEAKRGDIEQQADALNITHFKVGYSKAKLEMAKRRYSNNGPTSPTSPKPNGQFQPSMGKHIQPAVYENPVPTNGSMPLEYKPPSSYSANTSTSTGNYGPPPAYASSVGTVPTPPFTAPCIETCTALYPYTAQADGDLTFLAGAVIEIIDRSDSEGWWTGRYQGVQGAFPGNYVQLNKN